MTLDLTKWTSGTAGSPTTDPNLNGIPVMDDIFLNWPATPRIYVACEDPDLIALPSDPDGLDLYFQSQADERGRYVPDKNGSGISPIGSRTPIVSGLRVYPGMRIFDYFGVHLDGLDYHSWGMSTTLVIVPPAEPSGEVTNLEIHVPYLWHDFDLAEIIWSWSKFHSGISTQALLDELWTSKALSTIRIGWKTTAGVNASRFAERSTRPSRSLRPA